MKTKQVIKGLMVIAISSLTIFSCKKKTDPVEPQNTVAPTEASQKTTASDQSRVDQESNLTMDDVNSVLEHNSKTRAAMPCNIDIDSTSLTTGLIKLTYHGHSCDGLRDRSGVISIQLPFKNGQLVKWTSKGAKIIVTYANYKVTDLTTNKSIMFNGSVTATNVNGGGLLTLLSGTSIIHKLKGDMTITFDDGTTCSWGLAKSRVYTLSLSVLTTEITGDTTINGNTQTAFWGKTRAGDDFSVSVTTPVTTTLWGTLCLFRPYKGVVVIRGIKQQITITYGVDINGNPATALCPYGYKLNWTDAAGTVHTAVLPY